MWILPKQLHTSDFVPDTAALSLESTELSEICARSLFVRSKPSAARIWSQKWKRDSWTQHLSGRILNHSHGQSFVTAWTSSLGAIPASPSAQPESASAPMTLATSGHLSQTEFGFCDPSSASLRMSKVTSASDSEKSLENWNQSVTKRRGEYSARLKSAHRTKESGSSSWPSPIASEVRQGFQDRSRGMKGSQESLTTVVVKDAANWLTPATVQIQRTDMQKRIDYRASIGRKYVPGSLEEQMQQHGLPAPANPNTHGSRQELWPTATVPNGGQTTSGRADKASKRQVRLEHAVSDWPTITAHTPDMESSGPNGNSGTYLAGAVKSWATPRVGGEEKADTRLARGKDIGLHGQVGAMNNTAKLNPRWVETLMGLPVGWVMPSCKSPVTIEQTNCASSATESCLPPQSELLEF